MTQGKTSVNYLGREGMVTVQTEPSWDFLYEMSSIKSPKHEIGDRVVCPDGRVFRYCLAHTCDGVTTWEPGRGVLFAGTLADDGIESNVNRAQAIGDKELRYASQSFAKDELRGGYVVIYSAGNTYQQAGIVGNTYCSSSELTIYLDRTLVVAVTSTQYTEVLPNPYRYIGSALAGSKQRASWAGIPMSTPTAGKYFWVQTWGPCWVNPGGVGIGTGAYEREAVFAGDGSIAPRDATTHIASQCAGFVIEFKTVAGDGPPFINLQINP